MNPKRTTLSGFTLLEVLLALAILGFMAVMAIGSFQSLVDTTTYTNEALESLHQGEVVMDRVVRSLRSAAFFDSNPSLYTFLHEKGTGSPPDDMASWVTSTMTLLPTNYPTRQSLNRIYISIEEIDGLTGLAVSAHPYLMDPEDEEVDDLEPWLISSRVKGFELRYYDLSENEWVDEWERKNQLPTAVEITVYIQPVEKGDPLKELVRRVDIPVGKLSRQTRRGQRPPQNQTETQPAPTGGRP
jgi:type II secretion system protein J